MFVKFQGLVFETLSVYEYQDLIDRGWRRSGRYRNNIAFGLKIFKLQHQYNLSFIAFRYVYKPCMDQTCCPLYTIRTNVKKFQPSKSQRKALKQVHNFIEQGQKEEPMADVQSQTEKRVTIARKEIEQC